MSYTEHDVAAGYFTGAAVGAFLGAAGFTLVGAPDIAIVFGTVTASVALAAGYEFRRGERQ